MGDIAWSDVIFAIVFMAAIASLVFAAVYLVKFLTRQFKRFFQVIAMVERLAGDLLIK